MDTLTDAFVQARYSRREVPEMELGRIRGMGPTKVNQFGEAILSAIRDGE